MEFRILGPFEVWEEGRALALGSGRQRALLALLLLRRNEVVAAERLVEELWKSDPPATAAKVVQVYVSELRKVLDPDRRLLVTQPPGYRLAVAADAVDADRFELLAIRGREELARAAAAAASATLGEALALWRGPALADFAYENFAQPEIARLEELRLATLEERIEADLTLARHAELVGELEALVREHPVREGLRGQLMLALYRSGRQAEALDEYRDARATLVDELGIEPGSALQQLERAILRHEPSLEVAALAPPATIEPAVELRKPVSVVFVELEPAEADPETRRAALSRAAGEVATVLERHGAKVERARTDELVGVFGTPVVREDDALRAVRAAREIAADARSARVAVNSGEALVGAGSAAEGLRVARRPAPGEVLLGERTTALVANAVSVERVGNAFRLLEVRAHRPPVQRRADAPLIGRTSELERLRQAVDRVRDSRVCHVFTLVGPAGIGKSRLAAELRESVDGEAEVLAGRSLPYEDAMALWPMREIVRQAVGDDVRSGVAQALAPDPAAPAVAERLEQALEDASAAGEETAWAVRKLLEALARRRPLVLVFDDLHWAPPALLSLLEHVATWTRGVPLLLLCLARPELLERHPRWGAGTVEATTMPLEPLSADESAQLIAELGAPPELPADALGRVAELAEGNPFFIEQLLAMLSEDGEVLEQRMPATIHAILAARLDLLEPAQRDVIGRASVVGREFAVEAVEALVESPPSVRPALDALVRKDLVAPAPLGDALRFRHQLIRDAAYGSLPKRVRAELHVRFADWLGSPDELVGHHLEQAVAYQDELGEADSALAQRAAQHLAAAGRRAHARGDAAAVGLLARAAALLPPHDHERLELLPPLADLRRVGGDFAGAAAALDEALELARAAGDDGVELHARTARLRMRLRTEDVQTEELLRESEATIAALERLGDDRGLADAWAVRSWIPWLRCRAAETVAAAERSTEYARRVGDDVAEGRNRMVILGASLFGPTPVDDALRFCRDVIADVGEHRTMLAALAHRALAGLSAMSCNFDAARAAAAREREMLEDLGLVVMAAQSAEVWALVELLAGDAIAAERVLRAPYEKTTGFGDVSSPTLAAILARALVEQGRDEEALSLTETSQRAAGAEDLTTQVQWRGPRARVLARSGRHEEAQRLAREAVALAAETDFLSLHGDALLDLALVTNDPDVAAQAVELYERKGNIAAAARAREVLA